MGTPTVAGFVTFVRDGMGISTAVLPDNSPYINYAFNASMANVSLQLTTFPAGVAGFWTPYEMAVYNLGGDFLINYAPDQTGQTYFADARKAFGCLSFVAGVVASSYDEGTGETLATPDWVKTLTLSDLQRLKTPYGRTYLEIAQSLGPLWGLS